MRNIAPNKYNMPLATLPQSLNSPPGFFRLDSGRVEFLLDLALSDFNPPPGGGYEILDGL